MGNRRAITAVILTLTAYLALAPVIRAQQALPGSDISAPQVTHEQITGPVTAGEPLTISATVTDDTGIRAVLLFYRTEGQSDYRRAEMRSVGAAGIYMVTLPGVSAPAFEYYIQAEDLAGNILFRGQEFAPLAVIVQPPVEPAAAAAPAEAGQPAKTAQGGGGTNWLLIGLGVLAVVALAGASGGGGGGNGNDDTVSVTVGAPIPGN